MTPLKGSSSLKPQSDRHLRERFGQELVLASEAANETAPSATRPAEGDIIGAYRILRELGHGGMGTVYLAARDDREYEQRVAIKVIRADAANDAEIMARFRIERQILADLVHSNIARLLGGGVTETGQPYLVMEYIEGLTIDDYCRANSLSTRARLELFMGICVAVQFAHRNLVVHRDIKPSNILVTDDGVPKLVDFGIAKLLVSGSAPKLTMAAQRVMTIEYASPEQVRGEPITTATDIYSLGTVLYELLTGKLPFNMDDLNALEAQKSICETAPRPPSAMVERTNDRRALRGDLDNIVLMAMRKEASKRYASVEQMEGDLRRYLNGMPVIASKGSWRYRAGKFARRHWLAMTAAATLFLTVAGFGIGMAVLAARVARERDRASKEASTARAVSDFVVDLFRKTDPNETQGSVTAAELLRRGKERLGKELRDQPDVRARVLDNIGHAYNALGPPEEAVKAFRESIDLRGADAAQSDESWSGLGDAYSNMGRYNESIAASRRALAIRQKYLASDDERISSSLAGIATVLAQQGKLAEAGRTMGEAVAIDRRKGRLSTADGAERLRSYGMVLQKAGQIREALPILREAVALKTAREGELSTGGMLNQLGIGQNLAGHPVEGEQTLRRALAIARQVYGPENANVGVVEANLADSLSDQGRYPEAEALARDGLQLFIKSLGSEHPQLLYLDYALAQALDGEGRHAEAGKVLIDAVAMSRRVTSENDPHTISARLELGEHYQRAGEWKAAVASLEPGLAAFGGLGRQNTREYFIGQRSEGEAYGALGRTAEAEALLRSSTDGLRALLGDDATETKRSEKALAQLSGRSHQ